MIDLLSAAQERVDILTEALSETIASIESDGRFRATIVTSWNGGGEPQKVRVEVREHVTARSLSGRNMKL
jgi:hypothetical protein